MTEIVVDLPADPDPEATALLERLLYWVVPDVRDVRVRGPRAVVDYAGDSPVDDVAVALHAAAREITAGELRVPVVERRDLRVPLPAATAHDPFPELVARGLVGEEAPGAFTLTGALACLYEALDAAFVRALAPLGPRPVRLPTLLAPGTPARSGTLGAAPHTALFAFHLREGRDVPSRFAGRVGPDGDLDLSAMATTAERPEAVLSTAACQPYYRALRGRTLEGTEVVTARATAYRYESGATEGLRRGREFTVRELVCVGTADAVHDRRERLLTVLEELAVGLGLSARVASAADAFFIDDAARMRAFQLAFEVKHELLAELPFDGSELAVGSVNHHGDHFGAVWDVRAADGDTAHSCCLGLGLERWCYAVVAQHGLDPDGWPDGLGVPEVAGGS